VPEPGPGRAGRYADEARAQDISVYNVLLRDFMQAPSIGDVDLSQYTGKVGDVIGITATDDHAVQSVHVKMVA
jgi:hypothetical protein